MAKILIAEDFTDIRKVLGLMLSPYGHEIIEAENGQRAVDLAGEHHPDLILMDMSMPVLSGWDATRKLKSNPATADIPVIALTAHALKGDRERTWEAGCNAIITKPIDSEMLEHTINEILAERRADPDPDRLTPSEFAITESPRRSTGKLLSIHNEHVLVVDDDPGVADLIASELKAQGFRTSVADRADQALAQIESDPPALIICNASLPEISGYELTERIKQDPRLSFTPVILVTEGEIDWDRGLKAGADDFLDKPINPAKLLARARALTRLKAAVDLEANRANELASVLAHMASGLIILDAEGSITVVNGRGLVLLGVDLNDVIGVNVDDFISKLDIKDRDCKIIDPADFPLKRALKDGETVNRQEICVGKRDNQTLILSFNAAPIYSEHGQKIGAVSVFEDITEGALDQQQIEEQTERHEKTNAQIP